MQSNEEFVKFIGTGVYGSVDLVKYTRSDGSSFHAAVKSSYAEDYDSLNRELQILRELRGRPRIVECLGDYLEEGLSYNGDKVYKLLLEYASGGNLNDFMDKHTTTDRKLPDPIIRDFTRMILEGLVSIHGHGYVHCDLKPENILVFPCEDWYELKISDFGLSLKVGEVPEYWKIDFPFVGAPAYMSPESLKDGVAKKALDLWSLGCLVLEMYTGVNPWGGVNETVLEVLLFDGKSPVIPESVPCVAREFIETCFARNPEERGSANDLLSHRFLRREEEKIVAD
ncbi:hypothetical protein EUTSA_v10015480mg, partial [Eutrema salsugineum]